MLKSFFAISQDVKKLISLCVKFVKTKYLMAIGNNKVSYVINEEARINTRFKTHETYQDLRKNKHKTLLSAPDG